MKVAIDVREAFGQRTGKGHYTFSLMRALLKKDSQNNYILLARAGDRALLEKEGVVLSDRVEFIEIDHKGLAWHRAAIKAMRKHSVDVFLAQTSFIIPAFSSIPSVVVVHDLVAFLRITKHDAKATLIERLTLKRALKHACAVIAISENTKRDVIKKYPFAKEKIHVVYPGEVTSSYKPATFESYTQLARQKHLPEKYILFVGTIEPRKNIAGMIEAYAEYRQKVTHPLPFVLVGRKGWTSDEIYTRVRERGLSDSVIFADYISGEYLPEIYRHAACFFFPSLYEGFGLIILEAFRYRVPVITARNSSLPEVAGSAAVYVDPKNTKEMADALKKITEDRALVMELQEKGLRQLARFDWQKTAGEFIKILGQTHAKLDQKK